MGSKSFVKTCRFLAFANIRRSSHFMQGNHRTTLPELKRHGTLVTDGTSIYKFSGRRKFSILLCREKSKRDIYNYSTNFLVVSASKTMTQHAQLAWRRLSQICSYRGPVFPPISRVACAVSLALNRSNLVGPGVFGLIFGWSQRTIAEAEYIPTSNNLYMDALDGHVYLSSIIFSVLEGFILLLRAIYLVVLFSPTVAMAPFADSFGIEFREYWLNFVLWTLEKGGPAFIKWGQWAATRPDLFPPDLCSMLTKLHTKAPVHSFAYTRKAIEEAFHRQLAEVFEDFEEEPVASGSVAQVHRATLRFQYPGKQVKPIVVAVKVRHPGVGELIRRDFMIINLVAKMSKFMPTLNWLRLDESVQQFGIFMLSQVDLAREAAHLSRFIYNFRRWKDVSFPKPLYPLVHPAVLVESYEQGDNVLHYVDELKGNDQIKSALAHIGTHALLKMLLV
ncbi:hypothetical protein GIB67_023716 [Kingdonia uniflora]|uniref:ABC1 atypical kinase-like domain-containing protein n=1 Tax=Kingdonia uniflora TaxID=39325 RepID=A0A7J7MG92_9MAGN|nr:hypothetical protein GIB67_023716 [Kingdonia uniflora]